MRSLSSSQQQEDRRSMFVGVSRYSHLQGSSTDAFHGNSKECHKRMEQMVTMVLVLRIVYFHANKCVRVRTSSCIISMVISIIRQFHLEGGFLKIVRCRPFGTLCLLSILVRGVPCMIIAMAVATTILNFIFTNIHVHVRVPYCKTHVYRPLTFFMCTSELLKNESSIISTWVQSSPHYNNEQKILCQQHSSRSTHVTYYVAPPFSNGYADEPAVFISRISMIQFDDQLNKLQMKACSRTCNSCYPTVSKAI